jgi:group II intron reverse transcriptase/maturase
MQTFLREIAEKSKRERGYRFSNLYTMLNEWLLVDSWRLVRKNAAAGVDKVDAREYGKKLQTNVKDLVERLKNKSYRARLIRRQYIPKSPGKMRPLGIPVVEDKLLQTAASRILQAIYKAEFTESSYGYQPGRGAHQAIQALHNELQFGWYGYVVEADIKGFFDHIDHEWLIKMLELKINDNPFIRLIKKWLKAGILETDGQVKHPATGTPQGGIVSPVLANIYLHYVLDLWFEKVVKPKCKGAVYLCRYADDFVCLFQYQQEADKFYEALPHRMGKFGLELSAEKTRILKFSKFRMEEKQRFDFLGFEFSWGKSFSGKPQIKRRTSRKKLTKSVKMFTEWCKKNRCMRLRDMMTMLKSKLRGYYNYYGLIGNYAGLREFYDQAIWILYKWLNRRSQRKSYCIKEYFKLLKRYGIPRPRVVQRRDYQLTFAKTF